MDEEFNGRCVYWNTSTDLLLKRLCDVKTLAFHKVNLHQAVISYRITAPSLN